MLPFWVDWDYFQGCSCSGSMCNAKSPYKISTARTNSSVMARRTQAAIFVFSHGYSNESCWYWQDKTFPQLYFSKIDRYFYRLSASSPAIFFDFDMSKKSKITKSALSTLLRWTVHPASSRLPVSEVKYSRRKYRGSNSGPTRVYALSCLYTAGSAVVFLRSNLFLKHDPVR